MPSKDDFEVVIRKHWKADQERFWKRVKIDDPEACWTWIGGHKGKGYGEFFVGGKNLRAHRYAYRLLVGPIPMGLTIDHLCGNKLCVNPRHLEPVTALENYQRWRSGGPTTKRHVKAKRTWQEKREDTLSKIHEM